MTQLHKACWLHKFPSSPKEVRTIAHRLEDAGFDMLLPCVKQPDGTIDYHTEVGNIREEFRDWDPLRVLVEETEGMELSVHAWCCVFPEGGHSALLNAHPELAAETGEEWDLGEPQFRWACPNRPEVRAYEASIYREILDNYPVEGVHLDYIRFSRGLCFCQYCRDSYREATGGDLSSLGFFGWNNPHAHNMDRWIEWRCGIITRFVRRIREMSGEAERELSAAVFHYYPGGLLDIGQDWERWVREDLLDHVFPMNYNLSTRIAAKWTRNNVATLEDAPEGCRLWEGLHRHASMSTPQFIDQVRAVRDAGVEGVTIFHYPDLTDEDLSALAKL
jgi:uncharacterized lipoprotein YddW (UPF0748 family)